MDRSEVKRFTLRDVLNQESLGLRLVTAESEEVLDRMVLGAHGSEALHPLPWIQADWLHLVTGVRLVGSRELQARFVRELHQGGLAGLGFGTGIDFDTVPEAAIEEAERLGFPIFEIPLATPFREIIAFVNRSLLSDDVYLMRRLTSMREFLLDALKQDDPQTIILRRLASLLDGKPAILTRDGETVAGELDGDEIWPMVEASLEGPSYEVVEDDRRVVSAPIIDESQPESWLVVEVSNLGYSHDGYLRPLTETAALLLGGLAGVRRVKRSMERALEAGFVKDLLSGDDAGGSAMQERAARFGIDFASPARAILIDLPDSHAASAEELVTRAEVVFQEAGVAAILDCRDHGIVGFIQSDLDRQSLERLFDSLDRSGQGAESGRGAKAGRRLKISVGRPVEDIAGLIRSLRDAELANRSSSRLVAGKGTDIRWFEDFGLVDWLVTAADADVLRQKAEAVLNELNDDEVLIDTLESFLDHRLSVVRSAKSLHLHPNSLRYRLARIEEKLGSHLDDPDTLAALQLARRVLGR